MNQVINRFKDRSAFLLFMVFLLWALMIVIANPSGNFPLNDDWNYAYSVKTLIETGQLKTTCWTLVAGFTQVLLAALFCLVPGFSFEALRCFTLLLAFMAGITMFALLAMNKVNRRLAALATLLLLTNPLYFLLSNSFMTDIPFLSFCLLSIYFLSKSLLPPGGRRNLLAGTIFTCMAVLTRQIGIVIPIAFVIVMSLQYKKSWRTIAAAVLPIVSALICIGIYQMWLSTMPVPLSYRVEREWLRMTMQSGAFNIAIEMLTRAMVAFIYSGLFLLPLLLFILPELPEQLSKKERMFVLLMSAELAILLGGGFLFTHSVMPLTDNVFLNPGLGPILLRSTVNWPPAPILVRVGVTALGVIGASLLLPLLCLTGLRIKKRFSSMESLIRFSPVMFTMLILTFYLVVICFRGYFDRYLVLLIPLLAILICRITRSKIMPFFGNRFATICQGAGILLLVIYAAYALAGTHDYFSWNRARWIALKGLLQKHVSPMAIDGGLEFNGWYAYHPRYYDPKRVNNADMRRGDSYVVTLGALKGYREIARYHFSRWLPYGQGNILVLKRVSSVNHIYR